MSEREKVRQLLGLNAYQTRQAWNRYIAVRCPLHQDKKASASVHFGKQHFNCHGPCGGKSFKTLLHEFEDGDKSVEDLVKLEDKIYDPDEVNRTLTDKEERIYKKLRNKAIQFFRARGFNPESLPLSWDVHPKKKEDGKKNPFFGYLIFGNEQGQRIARNLLPNDNPKHRIIDRGPYWIYKSGSSIVWVVEGITDGLSLHAAGARGSIISFNGAGGIKKDEREKIIHDLGNKKTIILALDNDLEGKKGTREYGRIIDNLELSGVEGRFPNEYKDLNQYCLDNPNGFKQWVRRLELNYATEGTEFVEFILEHAENLPIIPSGIAQFDAKLCGGFRPGCHVFSGETGIGKTTFVTSLAIEAAKKKKKVLIISYEVSVQQMWSRIMSRFSSMSWSEIENNPSLVEEECKRKTRIIAEYITVVQNLTLPSILQAFHDYDMVFLDYLQRVRVGHKGTEGDRHSINYIMSQLSDAAVMNNKVFIIISSLNRASYGDDERFGLAESGRTEYTGTTITRINAIPPNTMFLKLQKNNRGPVGTVECKVEHASCLVRSK